MRPNRIASVLLVVLFMVTVMVGCAEVQVTKAEGSIIDANFTIASTNMPAAEMGSIPDDQARSIIAQYDCILQSYKTAATTNLLVNWFDKTKPILCTAAYYQEFTEGAALADETQSRAATQPTAWLNGKVMRMGAYIIQVKVAKDGTKGNP